MERETVKVFNSVDEISVERDCSLAIGTFDGMHIGHMKVLGKMSERAKQQGLATFVYTFRNNPTAFLRGLDTPSLIMDAAEKLSVLGDLGIDYVALVEFDNAQVKYDAEAFVHDVMLGRISAKHVTVGHDFKFGHGAASNARALEAYGVKYGFGVSIVEPVLFRDIRVSSTKIRDLLREGQVERASELLGRNHFIIGKVEAGNAIGRNIGVPTLNIYSKAIPLMKRGVYFTKCTIDDGKEFSSITNVGVKPTISQFQGEVPPVAETHILGYFGDLYGSTVRIEFMKWHRDERLFGSMMELSEAIHRDIVTARIFFSEKSL